MPRVRLVGAVLALVPRRALRAVTNLLDVGATTVPRYRLRGSARPASSIAALCGQSSSPSLAAVSAALAARRNSASISLLSAGSSSAIRDMRAALCRECSSANALSCCRKSIMSASMRSRRVAAAAQLIAPRDAVARAASAAPLGDRQSAPFSPTLAAPPRRRRSAPRHVGAAPKRAGHCPNSLGALAVSAAPGNALGPGGD